MKHELNMSLKQINSRTISPLNNTWCMYTFLLCHDWNRRYGERQIRARVRESNRGGKALNRVENQIKFLWQHNMNPSPPSPYFLLLWFPTLFELSHLQPYALPFSSILGSPYLMILTGFSLPIPFSFHPCFFALHYLPSYSFLIHYISLLFFFTFAPYF